MARIASTHTLLVLYFAIFTAISSAADEPRASEAGYTTLRSLVSESSETEEQAEGKSLIGTIETVKRVADILVLVRSKILPENAPLPSNREFSRPKMRIVQVVYNVKKDVEDTMKSYS